MAGFFRVFNPPRWIEWHVGEPLPPEIFGERVLTLQFDGHELDALLDAMKQTFKY